MKSIKSQRGLSIIETLITIVIILASMSAATSLILKSNKLVKNLEIVTGIGIIRSNIYNLISSDLAWKSTIDNASGLVCVKDGTDCSAAGGSFSLYTPDGVEFYDPSNAQNGFDVRGNACTGFNATNGNISCPFRVVTNWTPICQPAECAVGNVLLRLNFTFQVSLPEGSKYPINESRFNMQVVRNRL